MNINKSNILFTISILLAFLLFLNKYNPFNVYLDDSTYHIVLFIFLTIIIVCNTIGVVDGVKKWKVNPTSAIVRIVGNLIVLPLLVGSIFIISYSGKYKNIEFLNIETFTSRIIEIPNNTEIRILSFTEVEKNDSEKISYYNSIIGVIYNTSDTIRILSPSQLYSTKITLGYYHKPNELGDSLMKVALGESYIQKSKNRMVALNYDLPFQARDFKVVIGNLFFDDDLNQIMKEDMLKSGIDTNLLNAPQKVKTN